MENEGVTAYLDTQIVLWLYENKLSHLSPNAEQALTVARRRLVSGMAVLEIEYLHEIGRIRRMQSSGSSRPVGETIVEFLGLEVCDLPFSRIAAAALSFELDAGSFRSSDCGERGG